MRRHPFIEVIVITLVLTIIGTVVVLTVPWLPDEASDQAGPMDTLYDVLAVASVFVFALVMSILIVSVLRFRRRYGDQSDGDPIHGNTALEVVWTAIPTIIVTGAAIYSGVVLADIEENKPGTREINVQAQQFAWSFGYPRDRIESAGTLHLVKGVPYHMKMRSRDVIHSFWVPEFRMKKDVVPGMTTDVRFTPKREGTFTLVCTELCGLGHSTMRATVKVESQAAFDRWAAGLRRQSGGGGTQ